MEGETDLARLLQSMTPILDADPYGYVVAKAEFALARIETFATVQEAEGLTIIAKASALRGVGYEVTSEWARISLKIHSSLQAVGLTAAFATALGKVGVSANVIAGYYHDHIFVQWDRRHDAMSALLALSRSS
jgi:uncharacterized protein